MNKVAERLYFHSPAFLQSLLISSYGYFLYQKRYSGIYKEIRRELDSAKILTPEDIKAYQEEKLRQMVAYCANNIPYYQKLFSDQGLIPTDITTLQDLEKLPVLNKRTIQQQSHNFRPNNSAKSFIVQHTSGSTGTPLSIHLDERTYKLAMALLIDHEERHGIPFGSKRATFAGRMLKPANNMQPPFSRFNRAENQRLFSSYHINEFTFPAYKKELDQFQPLELIGYPSAICDLASHYIKAGSKPGFQPKAVITNSETLLLWQREKIESVFGCPVFDYYGTAEYVIFAGQDQTGVYQPNPFIGITEVEIGSDSNDTGRLLATSLSNKQMPLLRYDLGDTATLMNPSGEKIGRPALKSINGRVDDYIETIDHRLIGRIDHIFKGVSGIREAQVIQKQPGSAVIKVVKDQSSELDEGLLISNCRQRLGQEFQVEVEHVPAIPRGSNGKFRSVVREK